MRTESLKEFCSFVDTEYMQMLYHCETRWLSLSPAVECLVQMFSALKTFFLSQSKPHVVIRKFFTAVSLKSICAIFAPSWICLQQMWRHCRQKEHQQLKCRQFFLHTVPTSITEKLAPKFVTLKTKNLVTQMLDNGYK